MALVGWAWAWVTWVVQLARVAGEVSRGIPLTIRPGSDDGVCRFHELSFGLEVVTMTGPATVAPAAAHVDPPPPGATQATPV